jgi:predicted  nucleic acid-binding Zn-ribbon protein
MSRLQELVESVHERLTAREARLIKYEESLFRHEENLVRSQEHMDKRQENMDKHFDQVMELLLVHLFAVVTIAIAVQGRHGEIWC